MITDKEIGITPDIREEDRTDRTLQTDKLRDGPQTSSRGEEGAKTGPQGGTAGGEEVLTLIKAP